MAPHLFCGRWTREKFGPLREVAQITDGHFILTGNQSVILAGVSEKVKPKINAVLKKYSVSPESISGLRKNSIACVALPTCPLAFAEAERYLPTLVSKIENILENGISEEMPVQILCKISQPEQSSYSTTLEKVEAFLAEKRPCTPSLVIIGEHTEKISNL